MAFLTDLRRRSQLIRKGTNTAFQLPRMIRRMGAHEHDYVGRPPVLANSFPKSGTHLLTQILEALPGITNYYSFLASTPSVRFRERTRQAHLRRINRIAPGEMVSAHLHYAADYAGALEAKHAFHVFIYRDLRDVVVSEAHYLTSMTRWHRMHPHFRALPDLSARITAAITGMSLPGKPYRYPDVGTRFRAFKGWLSESQVLAVRFEDLRGPRRDSAIRSIAAAYLERCPGRFDLDGILRSVVGNMDPGRSHTFRRGSTGGWRDVFEERHRDAMKRVAGDLLIDLGYESDLHW